MAGTHAKLAPSSSAQWTACPAAPTRQEGLPDTSGDAADNGTVGHALAETCLRRGDLTEFDYRKGQVGVVNDHGAVVYLLADSGHMPGYTRHPIDDEMIESVTSYVTFVQDLAKGGELMVEQRLSIEHITGEPGAKGTSDTVILFPDEICIVDLKLGRVQVDAKEPIGTAFVDGMPADILAAVDFKPNTQLVMYGDAALEEFGMFGDFKRVRIIICQPRLGHTDEYVMELIEFKAWVEWIRERAALTRRPNAPAIPGEKPCKYCRASGDPERCPEQTEFVLREAVRDFDSLDDLDGPNFDPSNAFSEVAPRQVSTQRLARVYALIPLIQGFCKAVDSRVYGELSQGHPVEGQKMVDGVDGHRKWRDENKAVALFKSFRMKDDEIYDKSVISPTVAETLLKKKSPKQWAKCEALIQRTPGASKVVPEHDPRPALQINHADDFDDETVVPEAGDEMADFF